MLCKKEKTIEGHTVTLEVNSQGSVLLLINGEFHSQVETDPQLRVRLALAARQLWREALNELQPGVYMCLPLGYIRRKLFMSVGWEPHPKTPGVLVFYHSPPTSL